MLAVLGALAASAAIILIEVPSLLKKKRKRELALFIILLLLAAGLNIAVGLYVHIPNPLAGLNFIFKPVSDVVFGFMK